MTKRGSRRSRSRLSRLKQLERCLDSLSDISPSAKSSSKNNQYQLTHTMVPFYHAVFLLPLAICIPQPGAPFGPRPLPGQVLYAMPNMFSCQDTEDCCNDLYSDYVTFSRTSGHPNPIESGGAKVVDFNGWAIQFGCKERGSSEEYTGWWLLRCAPSYDPALRRSKGMAKGDYKAFCMEIDYTKSRNKFVHVLDSVVECLDFEKFPLAVKPRSVYAWTSGAEYEGAIIMSREPDSGPRLP